MIFMKKCNQQLNMLKYVVGIVGRIFEYPEARYILPSCAYQKQFSIKTH